jgi:hypothetical protein
MSYPVVRNLALAVGVAGGMVACSTEGSRTSDLASPLAPSAAADDNGNVSAHALPNAVFRTVPAADADGVVRGQGPLTVQFNNCQSRPGDEDDTLKFTYDWDNDGTVDDFGHCRWEHTFADAATARACVSDRRGNDVCRTWDVHPGRTGNLPAVTSITFTVDYVSGGPASPPFEFYLNGTLMGTAPISAVSGQCPAPPATFTITNPAWLEDQPNALRFVKGPAGTLAWPSVGWVHVQVNRADGSSDGQCLFDVDGVGPCMAAPNACLFPPDNFDPVDVSTSMN